jgi:hypothetical protein
MESISVSREAVDRRRALPQGLNMLRKEAPFGESAPMNLCRAEAQHCFDRLYRHATQRLPRSCPVTKPLKMERRGWKNCEGSLP